MNSKKKKKIYDYIFSTCNIPQLKQCLSPALIKNDTFTYVPCSLIYVSLDKKLITAQQQDILKNSFGYLNTELENDKILGCLFNSSIYENRCPEDKILLEFFVGGFKESNTDKTEKENITKQLKLLLGITKGISFIETIQWKNAIAQYDSIQKEFKQLIDHKSNNKKTFFLGNSLRGISVGNCIQYSKKITDDIF